MESTFAFAFHGTIPHGAEHTMYNAGNLPDSEVFLRPLFWWKAALRRLHAGFGTGSAYPQGRQHGVVHVFKPSSTYALNKRTVVFEAHNGVKTMTLTTPAMGSHAHFPLEQDSHDKTVFAALLMGILCTLCIYTYSTNNLDVLGLSPESQKARTLEIIVLLLGQTFLAFVIGRLYKTHPAWAYKLGFILVILFVVDFASSYQARNAINQHQTLTKSATEEHAKLIASQIGVSQSTAKELTDSAQRQRDNKLITGSAATAQKAAKQSDSAVELIRLHGETIKQIKPTEADTFGAWTGNVIFFAMLGLYLLNDAMWAFIGHFAFRATADNRAVLPAPVVAPASVSEHRADSVTPELPQRSDSGTPVSEQTLDFDKAKEAVKLAQELDRMPLVPPMPWKAAPLSGAIPLLINPVPSETAPKPPELPTVTRYSFDMVRSANRADSVTPKATKAPRKRAANGVQMDTGIEGKASHRYQRVRKLIEDKKVNPSIRAVSKIEGENINHDRAKKYLWAMVDEGLLIWNEDKKRFEYRPEVDPRQMNLGGL